MSDCNPGHDSQYYANAIVQTLREPLLVLNGGQRVRMASQAFYKMFKVAPAQTLGLPFYELGNGQWNIPALRKLLDELLPTHGQLDDYQVAHDIPDIGRRTIMLNARRLEDSDGNAELILLAMKDITARRQEEHLVEVSEIRYRRLFEAAHDGILILSAKSLRITDVNPFLMKLLDYPREYFIGKELWEIGIFRDKEANQGTMQELYKNGSMRYEDLPLQDRNGQRHPVEIVANVYQEADEPVIQCNIRDIAQRVSFERERAALLAGEQAARLEAEAANRSKDAFLANLGHEVRTPLNAMLGWATILRGGKCSETDLREGLEVIERNCKAQARLIDDMLDLSRIISGKLRLEIVSCELVQVIAAAIASVRPAAQARHMSIEADLDSGASSALCDPYRMQQVVWNLLVNAVKFAPQGTKVLVTLAGSPSGARIQVIDEGQGISPELLPHVFDRFRQADGSTRRKLGGLGLGLSIVKHIIEGHGGTVQAQSDGEGLGATFTINLPISALPVGPEVGLARTAAGAAATPDMSPVRLDRLRVLVVDDEADVRRLLIKTLGDAGAVVTAAGSVAEAMAALPSSNPHVLVSDIAMPDRDGYDFIRQVRGLGMTPAALPAAALSAFANNEDRRRALSAGFQVHVAKPIDPHALTAVIAALAGNAG